jgi:hypothetical protein
VGLLLLAGVFSGLSFGMLLPFVGALVRPIDPAEDITFMVRHPWRWRLRHAIIAAGQRHVRRWQSQC